MFYFSLCFSQFIHVLSRPLPRGLIPYKEAVLVINLVLGALSMYAVILSLRFSLDVGITFGIAVRGMDGWMDEWMDGWMDG